jgi:hypothetical protein
MARDTYIRAAFDTICVEAVPASAHYVSLYMTEPFYGGPEEGGWWGSDTTLVSHVRVDTREHAEAIRAEVEKLAADLSKDAKDSFNRQCAAECAWLEQRGLDADYLPEVDGEVSYWVTVEDRAGEMASTGARGYS